MFNNEILYSLLCSCTNPKFLKFFVSDIWVKMLSANKFAGFSNKFVQNDDISRRFFFHFCFRFWLFRLSGGRGERAGNGPKLKKSIHQVPFLSNSIAYDYDFWYTCLKWWYLETFLIFFFKILIFWVVSWVKEKNMVQNDKKLCLLCFISQEPYIIWFSLLYTCVKWWYPPCVFSFFSFFQSFDFSVC